MSARILSARQQRNWSQSELAVRAGVSRQLVGAIEAGRHAPNVAAAIALARALGRSVEELFDSDPRAAVPVVDEALRPGTAASTARVGDQMVAVALAHGTLSAESWAVADAVIDDGSLVWLPGARTEGLVVAGCDPILGLAAGLVQQTSANRVITAHASTGAALEALAAGRVHGVLVHGPGGTLPSPPVPVRRWHVARWQVGLTSRQRGGPPTVVELAERRTPVVQREQGAGTQRALVRALRSIGADEHLPGPVADGHLDVARRVASGAGRTGVTMEAAARAFGLGFVALEEHDIELWIDARWVSLAPAIELAAMLGDRALLERVAHLPGYDLEGAGAELQAS